MSFYNQHLSVTRFKADFYKYITISGLCLILLPIVRISKRLLAKSSHDIITGHLVLLSTKLSSVVAPALFSFAESAGCVHSRGYRECFPLLEANFTVEMRLILGFVKFLLFGFMLERVTVREILNFSAPFSVIFQLFLIFWSSMVSFAVFGMRPRDVPDTTLRGEFFIDPSITVTKWAQAIMAVCWIIIYILPKGYTPIV